MSRNRFLSLGLVLAILLCGALAPLTQPSVALGAMPNQPENLSPIDETIDQPLTPTLTASAFSDPDAGDTHAASQWQIRTILGDYTTGLVFDSGTDNVSLTSIVVPPGRLVYLTTYYWHVSHQDNNGAWSAWSDETSFSTISAPNQAPNTPSNISPSDDATGVSLTPTLTALAFSDPDAGDTHAASQWQIRTSSGEYSSPVYDSEEDGPPVTTITAPSLDYSTTYYWHVRYQDNHGAWSAYSTETSFTTMDNQPPDEPIAISPTGLGISVTPTLISSAFSDDPGDTHYASEWQVRLATANNWNNPVFYSGTDNVNLTTIIIPSGELSYSTLYLWRVRHQDNYGAWSDYSEPTWFQTSANQIPGQPVNSLPVNGASGLPLTPTLVSSSFSDPDPGDTHGASQWQIGTILGDYTTGLVFDSGTDNVSLTSIVVPPGRLVYLTTYYWHVRHQDNNGAWSAWSAETSFSTAPNYPPNQPANSSPASGASGESLTPTLASSLFVDPDAGDTHAASQWQITTILGDYTTGLVFDSGADNVNLTSIVVPSGRLSYFTTYYWRVQHQDNNGAWSAWSAETSFTTAANQPPGVPVNSEPANLATGVSLTPTLQSSAFNDPGDTHAASQWQITTVATNWAASLVWDNVTFAPDLTRTVVPSGLLSYSTTYYWRVRHQDSQEAWSAWSAPTSFSTRPPGTGADFVANLTVLIAGQPVQFTDTSTGAIVSWTWDFGDGTAPVTWSTRPSDGKVSHAYAAAGTYTVALTVTDGADESYTETKPDYIRVFVLPAADFSVSATAIVLGEAVAFTNLSSGGIPPLTYAWDFDDDGVVDSTSPNPSHSYGATGTYTVSLKVTDARGNSTTERRAGYISVSSAIAPHTIPPEGGIIQTADGRIAVTFPEGAVAGEATLNIDGVSPSAVAKAPDGYKVGNTCFAIEAVDAGGRTVAMSSQWVTVTVKYSDEDVAAAGGKPENLVLARYNSATGKWTVLDTTLNKADRSLSANTTHFSTWAVMAKKPSGGMASWIFIIMGIAAGLAVAVLIVRAVAIERTGKVRQEP